MSPQKWRSLVRFLRKKLPPAMPTRVYVRRIADFNVLGSTDRTQHGLSVTISNRISAQCQVDVLLHEWAHAISWRPLPERGSEYEAEMACHRGEWALAYGKVYRAFLEWLGPCDADVPVTKDAS